MFSIVILQERHLFICQAITLMKKTHLYWDKYFNDFLHHKLGFSQDIPRQTIADQLLQAYLQPIYDIQGDDYLTRLIALHILFRVNQIDLERLAKVLTYLSKLESLDQSLEPAYSASLVESTRTTPIRNFSREVATIVCNTLYESIRTSLKSVTHHNLDQFSKWYDCYQAIVSICCAILWDDNIPYICFPQIFEPLAEEQLLSTTNNCLHAKLTILHATYLVMQCSSTTDAKWAIDTFKQLDESSIESLSHDKVSKIFFVVI